MPHESDKTSLIRTYSLLGSGQYADKSDHSNATIDLQPENIFALQPVLRNGYDFSDGVGTISEGLLRRIWRVYGARRLLKPTALQIRFQGYKGMVSVDSRLQGEVLKLRSNMQVLHTP